MYIYICVCIGRERKIGSRDRWTAGIGGGTCKRAMTILVAPLRTAMVLMVVAGGRAVRSIPPATSDVCRAQRNPAINAVYTA